MPQIVKFMNKYSNSLKSRLFAHLVDFFLTRKDCLRLSNRLSFFICILFHLYRYSKIIKIQILYFVAVLNCIYMLAFGRLSI